MTRRWRTMTARSRYGRTTRRRTPTARARFTPCPCSKTRSRPATARWRCRPISRAPFPIAATLFKELGRYEAAIESYDRAIALQPAFAEAHSNRGNALHELHRFEDALAGYDRALALRPDFAEAHLQSRQCFAGTAPPRRSGGKLRPRAAAAARHGRGALEPRQCASPSCGSSSEALESFDRAQALRPDLADAHFNAALCRLLTGDFVRGWEEYEWRWEGTAQLKDARRNLPGNNGAVRNRLRARPFWFTPSRALATRLVLPLRAASRGARRAGHSRSAEAASLPDEHAVGRCADRVEGRPPAAFRSAFAAAQSAAGVRHEARHHPVRYAVSVGLRGQDGGVARAAGRRRPPAGRTGVGRQFPQGASQRGPDRSPAQHRVRPAPAGFAGDRLRVLQPPKRRRGRWRSCATSGHGRAVIDWTEELHDFSDTAALVANLDIVVRRRYRGRAPRRRAGQAVSADESLQHLLALAARPGRQPGIRPRASSGRTKPTAGNRSSRASPTRSVRASTAAI